MKRITFTFCALVAMSASTHAQSTEAQIAKATLAAPPSMQADTMVIRLAADGNHTILREGSNGLVCWDRSDEPNRSFSVQCSSVENMDRIKQNRAWNMSGKTAEEIRAMRPKLMVPARSPNSAVSITPSTVKMPIRPPCT